MTFCLVYSPSLEFRVFALQWVFLVFLTNKFLDFFESKYNILSRVFGLFLELKVSPNNEDGGFLSNSFLDITKNTSLYKCYAHKRATIKMLASNVDTFLWVV